MTDFGWENELPALADKTDQEAADAIAAMSETRRQLVPLWKLGDAARAAGWWMTTKAAVETNNYAAALMDYYTDPHHQNIDLDLDPTNAVIAGLVETGIITQEQADSIDALANIDCLKYEGPIYSGQVAEARKAVA